MRTQSVSNTTMGGGAYDPGLLPVELQEGQDSYTQPLIGGSSTLTNGTDVVPAVTANKLPFGMEDKALSIKGLDDRRVKLTDLNDGPADGSYEFAFRTGENFTYTSLGFLARYVDETKYVGLSIDGALWQLHAAKGTVRQNTPFPGKYETLKANTTYKIKLGFVGDQISLQVMKEGDKDYTDMGSLTADADVTRNGGAFAIRLRTSSDVYIDNIVQYDTKGEKVKDLDFNNGEVPGFEVRNNKVTNTVNEEATLEIKTGFPTGEEIPGLTPGPVSKILNANGVYVDSASPIAEMGIMTVQLKGSSSKYGLVFNHKDENNYATIEFDGTKWIAGGKNDGKPVAIELSKDIPAIAADDTRTLRLSKDEKGVYTLTVSGGPGTTVKDSKSYELGALEGIYTGDGKLGVVAGEAMTLYAGPINFVYTLKAVQMPVPTEGVITLESKTMKAVVGDTFPHIYAYLDKDNRYLTGTGLVQGKENKYMTILTEAGLVKCETQSVKISDNTSTSDSATYQITATGEGVEAVFTVVLQVKDNTLELKVTNVEQKVGTVRTFAFDDLQMVAVIGRGAGAALGMVNGWGPATDTFIDLKTSSGENTYSNMTYALFYDTTTKVTAAVENNVEKGTDKYRIKQNAEYPYLSASNTAWAWKYYDNTDPSKNLPYAKVVIGGDENQDGVATWQDAGIAYRDIMIKAYGHENTKNEWMYIAMNMSSGASQSFLRVLDEAKAISYLTDGFGMKIMNKGYQAGGHDDSHGDYDFVGEQQGGVDDFNTLINEGLKYGIKNGVHINATEFALDGYETKLDNMTRNNGELVGAWGWFDKAFNVNKSMDVMTNELERRLDEFEDKVPNLDFFYVDVYQSGSNFNATEFMRYMNENGANVGTEALGDFNQQINFVHWNTDLNYSTGGAQSQVLKFVTFGQGDLTAPDHALLGALMPGISDWRNSNDFNAGARVFYRNNLPAKYLQHFELLNWVPDQEATLSGNVRTLVTEKDGSKYTEIYKDEKLIARIDTTPVKDYDAASGNPMEPKSSNIFIPWSPEVEDKIYCYTDDNSIKTWDVPNTWSNVTDAYLYTLTVNGRENAQTVKIENGKITLNLDPGTPYILVKGQEAQAHRYNVDGSVMVENGKTVMLPTLEESQWGYGSQIKNFGFTGQNLDGWKYTDGIAIDTNIKGDNKSNPRVVIPASVEGNISQTITVEPGKTYSISAWTMAEGNRSPELTVQAGSETKDASVLTTAGIPIRIKPSKYTGMDYQRLKVDITIPAGVTEAIITFSAEAGENPVYVDDFRCWEWLTDPNPLADDYYYFEDFENVDENWGPFISQVNNQPFIHLSYKNPEGGQIKYYTLDTYDENGNPDVKNLTSLKGRQKDSYGSNDGLMMRTLPSTLDFKSGETYLVEIDHASFLEELSTKEGNHIGYNYPLTQALYIMDVRSANGEVIASYPLKPSEIVGEGFNARPITQTLSFVVDAKEESGIYLTFRRDLNIYQLDPNGDADSRPAFILDNVRVSVIDETKDYTVTFETTPADASVEVKDANDKVVDPVDSQNGKTYMLKAGSYSYSVSADGYVTKTANFTITKEKNLKVDLKPVTYQIAFATTPEKADVNVKDAEGKTRQPNNDGSYALEAGTYSYTVSADGYVTKTGEFTVSKEETITVELEEVKPVTYKVTFTTTPKDAEVTVKDAEGKTIGAEADGSYVLESGSYTYTVSAEGYVTKNGEFTVSKEESIKVELDKEVIIPDTYKVTFTTSPENASVTLKDAQGKEVQPTEGKTYTLEAGSYSYTVSAEGYTTKNGEITVSEEASVKVTLEKKDSGEPDTPVVPDTPDEPDTPDQSGGSDDSGSGSSQEIVTDWNKVKADVKATADNKQASGKVLNVVTGENITVTPDVLKTLKGQPTTLALHTGKGLTFSLSGSEITKAVEDAKLNLTVRQGTSSIPVSVMNQKLNGTIDNRKISMVNEGDFGMNVNMHLSMGAKNAGKYANLYRYDKQKGQMLYLGSFKITENGQAMFGIRRGGEFLATVTQERPNEKVSVDGSYTVVKGDTLSRIAARNGVTLAQLIAANPQIKDINKIRLGQQIVIK